MGPTLKSSALFSPDSVTAMVAVSLFYRFEVQVERDFLEADCGLNIANLIKRGDLKEQNAFVLLHHSSLAELYANVCRSKHFCNARVRGASLSLLSSSRSFDLVGYVRAEPRNLCEFLIGILKELGDNRGPLESNGTA